VNVGPLSSLCVAVSLLACSPPASPPPPQEAPPARTARLVSASVIANDCGRVTKGNAKLAEDAMNKLIEGCSSVPGGSARFTATLEPGGRIELAQSEGAADVVPICVLKHELRHKVPLVHACKLDVRLDESAIDLPDAGASD
jgi:hypothetical protein